ncbi:S1-like domain-containing RNA-binding protein [Saprospiraceae bacterium]|nr:S1-like domain-containing RNA-binding protein [Saprospiraceae bacterium]
MADLGRYSIVTINRFTDFGAYIEGGDLGEILLPIRYIGRKYEKGDEIEVFIYLDNEERYIATTEDVIAEAGECGYMDIVDVNEHGAFADWGLTKDLFIPFREQQNKLVQGESAVVYVYIDDQTNRITGTTKIEDRIRHDSTGFRTNDKVKAIVLRRTPAGFLCVLDSRCLGMLYENELFEDIRVGDKLTVFIKKIRSDRRVDLRLREPGYGSVRDFSDDLYDYLVKHKVSNIHDKSDPKAISEVFGVSKKVFKKAVGKLYKEKKIALLDGRIEILESQDFGE